MYVCMYVFVCVFTWLCSLFFWVSINIVLGQSFHMSHVQNCRQLILVFGGIYSLKKWMASHARKLFTSFVQAHVRASFAQARNHVDTWNLNKWIYNENGHTTTGRDEMGDEFRCFLVALFAWYVGPLACQGIVSSSKQDFEWMPWILNGNRPWS